ncbi:hypothetical protein ACOJUR_01285 [Alicyclobacillus tolerans]|uniref:hypothetical protein n=1 Tax=Alicyclobacillus tolerans TaxID=90970 RepID=UPI003B78ABE7
MLRDKFIECIVESCDIVRKNVNQLSIVAFTLTTGPVTTIESILNRGYRPLAEFHDLYQTILNEQRCGRLGIAFLTFYCGVFDDPSAIGLQVRARKIYQSAMEFRNLHLWELAVWTAGLAEASFNQIGYKSEARTAQKLKFEMTFNALPWWPKACNKEHFKRRKLIRWKISVFVKKRS